MDNGHGKGPGGDIYEPEWLCEACNCCRDGRDGPWREESHPWLKGCCVPLKDDGQVV